MQITDWDDAYANGAYIPGADAITDGWAARAGAFRAAHQPDVVRTGAGERQFVDLYRPEMPTQGLTMFVHGGYWMALSAADFAHLAAGPLAAGQTVGLVNYTLAPKARISEITAEVAQAIRCVTDIVKGPIRLVGHSAGGHLVARMACDGVLPHALIKRIARFVSISGVHDLRPLRRTAMNETLQLTMGEAVDESPALRLPCANANVTCVVGAEERPEFLRQSDLLANIWHGLGARMDCVHLPDHNHFTVIEGLERPDSTLTKRLIDR